MTVLSFLTLVGVAGNTELAAQTAIPEQVRSYNPHQSRIQHGGYLLEIAGCARCHAGEIGKDSSISGSSLNASLQGTEVMQVPLSGGLRVLDEIGTCTAANITPHPETGIGNWTLPDIVKAIRSSISRDGSLLSVGAHQGYRWMADEDAVDIAYYLQAQRPVEASWERRDIGEYDPDSWRFFSAHAEVLGYVPVQTAAVTPHRGLYLVRHIATCSRCHSPESDDPTDSDFLGGTLLALEPFGYTSDPTLDPPVQVPSIRRSPDGSAWTQDTFNAFLNANASGASTVSCPRESYRQLQSHDRQAIALFLASLPE